MNRDFKTEAWHFAVSEISNGGAEFIASEYDDIVWRVDNPPSKVAIQKLAIVIERDMRLADMRAIRNRLLVESDWTQVADAPVDSEAWARYRQELRDLPETITDVSQVVWPSSPE